MNPHDAEGVKILTYLHQQAGGESLSEEDALNIWNRLTPEQKRHASFNYDLTRGAMGHY